MLRVREFPDSGHMKVKTVSDPRTSRLSLIHSLAFSLEGRAWQEPDPSHVTGMALAHCILGKFLGVVCHCFPPPLDVPRNDARDPSSERWNCGRQRCPVVILPNSDFHVNSGIFHMSQIYDMGPTALLPLRRKAC